MVDWPSDLPKRPPDGSFSINLIDPTVRNQPERGPPMVRRRASVEWEVMDGVMVLTREQCLSLRTFWKTTTSYGSVDFNAFHWREEQIYTMRFGAAPGPEEHIVGNYYRVPVQLVRIPV